MCIERRATGDRRLCIYALGIEVKPQRKKRKSKCKKGQKRNGKKEDKRRDGEREIEKWRQRFVINLHHIAHCTLHMRLRLHRNRDIDDDKNDGTSLHTHVNINIFIGTNSLDWSRRDVCQSKTWKKCEYQLLLLLLLLLFRRRKTKKKIMKRKNEMRNKIQIWFNGKFTLRDSVQYNYNWETNVKQFGRRMKNHFSIV